MEQKVRKGCELLVGGVGGQGVLTAGKLLAEAGMSQYKYVLWFPNYGASMRGGESECVVILSDEEISSPIVHHPQDAILMDSLFQGIYQKKVKAGGRLIIDSSVINAEAIERQDITLYQVPATEIALEVGSTQISNMVLVGAYLAISGVVAAETIEKHLDGKYKGTRHEKLIAPNKEALRRGIDYVAMSL